MFVGAWPSVDTLFHIANKALVFSKSLQWRHMSDMMSHINGNWTVVLKCFGTEMNEHIWAPRVSVPFGKDLWWRKVSMSWCYYGRHNGKWSLWRLEIRAYFMLTSSNGNIFRVTGHLCGEFTGPQWIPHTKASDAELWCFLWSASE